MHHPGLALRKVSKTSRSKLKWEDINTQWKGIQIKDKVEGTREISAQIQGHWPQGVREQNYIRRPLNLLRVHHEKIEAWILMHAGILFDAKSKPGKLLVVAT